MAGKKKLTEHQVEVKKALRRAKMLEKKGFVFDYDKLSRMRTATLKKLYQDKLMERAEYFLLYPKTGEKEGERDRISAQKGAEWYRALKKEKRAKKYLGKLAGEVKLYATTEEAFDRALSGTKKRGSVRYWRESDIRMRDNYLQALNSNPFNEPTLVKAITDKVKSMPPDEVVEILTTSAHDLSEMGEIFDSITTAGTSHVMDMMRAFGLKAKDVKKYNPEWNENSAIEWVMQWVTGFDPDGE